jgi:L-alanine-DL-glutamate epimerase-like enolase superfamily enzyme
MIQIDWLERELPLLRPFRISRYTINVQPTLLVRLSVTKDSGERICGYGVANSNLYYQKEMATMVEILKQFRAQSKGYNFQSAEKLWEDFSDLLSRCRFTQCAVDVAAHDLEGKREGIALWKKWGGQPSSPVSSYTLGMGSLEETLEEIRRMPWPVYKIKMGAQADPEWIGHLRKTTGAKFRIDANASWTPDQTLFMAEALAPLGVEMIEQPLTADDWEGMRKIKEKGCALPIFADESCQVLGDEVLCAQFFDGINIKLMKCGGLTPARKMIDSARNLGLKLMVGCMTESVVGIAAGIQLMPWVDFADLDGSLLLAEDVGYGLDFREGRPILTDKVGTGIEGVPDFITHNY